MFDMRGLLLLGIFLHIISLGWAWTEELTKADKSTSVNPPVSGQVTKSSDTKSEGPETPLKTPKKNRSLSSMAETSTP